MTPLARGPDLGWVVLTTGDRPQALVASLTSLDEADGTDAHAIVVVNGAHSEAVAVPGWVCVCSLPTNVGIPSGRHRGVMMSCSDIVGFLDDDAVASPGIGDRILAAFEADPQLGAVALRLVDERGDTARRHVPRFGGRRPERGGDVAVFLGGACAIRRAAYDQAGGYWGELFYGHEELELSWRLIDHGWKIRYLPHATVFHPRTELGRHADGWQKTGRNRVMIARRTLPWPIAIVHVAAWFVLGLVRAPGRGHRAAYVRGWWSGWSEPVDHRPIRWPTVWRLTRLGRPPVL